MRALVCEAYGPIENLKIEDMAVPEPKAGEVLVRVGAAGVSFAALLGMQGKHQNKPALPYVPGNEMAGDVVKLGDGVTNLKVGQRITTGVSQGAYAEYAVARRQRRADSRHHALCRGDEFPDPLSHRLRRAANGRPTCSRARCCWFTAPAAARA